MRRLTVIFALLAGLAGLLVPALAGAREDVRIRTDRDERRTTIYKLVNTGSRTVRVKVQLKVECSGVQSDRKPKVQEHWLSPEQSIELGKTRAESACRRDYRVLEASYP